MLKSVNRGTLIAGVLNVLLASLFTFAGCSSNGKPQGLLGKGEMVRAMTELYLAEQKVATVGVSRDSTAQMFRAMSPAIFDQVGVSDSVFRLSFDYYLENPIVMEEIYTALIDSLNLREQKMISNELKK
ncbi:MAG TPA: DUF4296 domain-containing protein [Chryseolinea sp.]|nr:DUF4296 domain-containing protein [Chryseolinea sp.]